MADLTTNLKAPKPTPMQEHKTVTMGQAFDIFDALGKGFITGLGLEWVSSSSIRVKTGAAVMPGGGLVTAGANITVTGIAPGGNTVVHVYLYDNGGAATVETSTTAPTNYFGSAWQKGTDATRRYLGSLRTDASGNIYRFNHLPGNRIQYRAATNATPFRVINGITSTGEVVAACSPVVPVTAVAALVNPFNGTPNAALFLGQAGDLAAGVYSFGMSANTEQRLIPMPLNSSLQFVAWMSAAPSSSGGYVDVAGYIFDR